MKRYFITILALLTFSFTFAQDFYDALRYAQTEYGGTARSISMGSAFGALGGDFVSASINPAGLGFYRSGELTLSPTLNFNQMESSYLNNLESDYKYNFNFNNLSYVATANTGIESGIVNFSFGVGYNRLKNFHSNAMIQGFGANTTLLNYYTDYANSIGNVNSFDPHYEGLAWNTYLVDEDLDPEVIEGIYYNDLTDYQAYEIYDENNNYLGIGYDATGVKPHQQKKHIEQIGKIDEYLLSMGANVNHKFYFGASIGLVDLQFKQYTMYSETDNEEQSAILNNFTLDQVLTESGFGINFKAGIIYRPIPSLRLGAAFHTPTFYEISRYDNKQMTANYDQGIGNPDDGYYQQHNDDNYQDYAYELETPLKINLSAAYTFADKGLISVDYEMVNYANARFRAIAGDNFDYSGHNSDIDNVYQSVANIRIGGEYRLTPNFSLRAGYNLLGNPWQDSYTFDDGTSAALHNNSDTFSAYTGGFGYRQNKFFVDFAYRLNQNNFAHKVHEIYYTNPGQGDATATITELNHQATVTFGFRF
ncbi:OmpP1/FadL family transporter [Roseimarinus sediminis]|uniref:OmpP1/FadL family transporter n=1 Tax=Roseimarinus sediminis TaxID=1610899 RepID=UPI003D25B571